MHPSIQEQLSTALQPALRIERELDGGGMSRVFLATDVDLGRKVVVKVLPPELLTDVSLERFRREIRIAATLRHPNIVPLLAAGQIGAMVYYTMPYVDGESLRDRLVRAKTATPAGLSIAETVSILRDVTRAASYAHRQSVAHRDIKPENILLSGEGLLVTDFGVAKALSASTSAGVPSTISGVGSFIGTPAYMAPEQATGEATTDHRADIYSLGVLGYEMLAGATPFAGRAVDQTLAAHLVSAPAPLASVRPDIPPELSDVLMRCLAKLPAQRPSADELFTICDRLAGDRRHGRSPLRSSRRVLIAAAAVALIGLPALAFATRPARSRWMMKTVITRPSNVLHRNRFVIQPFLNASGDTALESLGAYAADNIGDALRRRVPGIEVVDPRTTELNARVVEAIPWYLRPFRSIGRALADESGAAMLITGRYYREGSSVRIHTSLVDLAPSHRRSQPIQETTGPRGDPRALVRDVEQRVVAAVAQLSDTVVVSSPGAYSDPPSLDAFTAMRNAVTAYFVDDTAMYTLYHRAERLDATYVTPTVFVAYIDGWNSRPDELAKDLARGRRLIDQMAVAERAMFDYAQALYDGDLRALLPAARRFTESLPGSAEGPLLMSSTALGLHDTAAAREALSNSDPDRGLNLASGYYWLSRIGLEKERGDAVALGAAVREAETRFPDWVEFRNYDVRALAARGDLVGIRRAIESAQQRRLTTNEARLVVASQAATGLLMNGRVNEAHDLAAEWVATALPFRGDTSRWIQPAVAGLLLIAGRSNDLVSLPQMTAARASHEYADRLSFSAVGAIQGGDSAAARRIDAELAATHPPHLDFGYREAARARIAAHFGEPGRAMDLLGKAVEEGIRLHLPWGADFRTDPFLGPLRAHRAFAKLSPP